MCEHRAARSQVEFVPAFIVTICISLSVAQAGDYRYVKIGGSELRSCMTPSLDSAGRVAFTAWPVESGATGLVLAGDEHGLVKIAETSEVISGSPYAPAISDSGTVAFWTHQTYPPADKAIFTGNGGPLTRIVDNSGYFYDFFLPLSANASGTVAFAAEPRVGGFRGIYAYQHGSTQLVVGSGGDLASNCRWPQINDSGAVAFLGGLLNSPYNKEGVFLAENGTTRTVFSMTLWGAGNEIGFPSLNNNNGVAFTVHYPSGLRGILVSQDDVVSTLIDNSGPFDRFGQYQLNDYGRIAFAATLDSGVRGIFTGPDPVHDKVIAIGDSLDGSVVTGFDFGNGFNEEGQVAFTARLADGRRIIFRADPVPEPTTASLLAGTALAFAYRRRGARR